MAAGDVKVEDSVEGADVLRKSKSRGRMLAGYVCSRRQEERANRRKNGDVQKREAGAVSFSFRGSSICGYFR